MKTGEMIAMRDIFTFPVSIMLAIAVTVSGNINLSGSETRLPTVFEFTMKSLDGDNVNLEKYRGKPILIVNVASECGYTYQYEGLQKLHEKYAKRGLVVLGFPSNDFGQQEPGSAIEIKTFCERNYGVKFDMFAKVVVRGPNKVPLYDYLTSKETNPESFGEVKWNFEKFIINREGKIVGRFRSNVEPESKQIVSAIESALTSR